MSQGKSVSSVTMMVRPHTAPRGSLGRGAIRPQLSRRARSKTWRVNVMEQYLNKEDHTQDKPFEKLQRACKAIRVIAGMCLLIKRYAKKEEDKQRSFLETNLTIQEEIRREIAFDINQYKFHPGVKHLAGDRLRRTMSVPTEKRDVHVMMALLRQNDEVHKYPPKTQIEICRSAIYQRYGPRRVILREGHRPEGFYIVVSGHVLINVMETHPKTGKTWVSTVNEVGPGASFGEISLLSDGRRTSTVVCKTDVEFLVIMKEDFDRVIKEPLLQQRDNHIDYIKSLPLFKDFPIDKLKSSQNAFSCKCFRKDTVVIPCGSEPDQLVVVKEGVCTVIAEVKVPRHKRPPKSPEQLQLETLFPLVTDRRRRDERKRRCQSATALEWETGEMRELMRANILMGVTEPDRVLHAQSKNDDPQTANPVESWVMKRADLSKIYKRLEDSKKRTAGGTSTPHLSNDQEGPNIATSSSSSVESTAQPMADRFSQKAKEIQKERVAVHRGVTRTFKRIGMIALQAEQARRQAEEIDRNSLTRYAKVATLGAGSTFGLETIFQPYATKLSLVSEGSQCILISKKMFVRECNPKVLTVASHLVVSYPSDLYVKRQLKEKKAWSRYRRTVVTELLTPEKGSCDLRDVLPRAHSAHFP